MAIKSFSPFGYKGSIITVEVDIRHGIPSVDLVGLADGAVRESRERVRAAIKNQGFKFPQERVLISLSPADMKKEGAGFDLAIALSILSESEDMPRSQDADVLVMGELELSGDIRPVRGVYAALTAARESGIKYAIIPEQTEAVPDGIIVKRVKNLREAFESLCNVDEVEGNANDEEMAELMSNGFGKTYNEPDSMNIEFGEVSEEESLDNVRGMNGLKYAMAVAVAGRHNIMAWGSPGCGKTMTLQRITQLMPKLLPEEIPSVQRIYSIAGLLKPDEKRTVRPFRVPHHTTSLEGVCGGGANIRPGEISLAHNGVLFLDEVAEFKASALQMLRVPLESGIITLCRAGRSTTYPANFQLVMATNPCPCGNLGSKSKICLCSSKSVDQYWKKFSAPLLDRIGIRFDCNAEDDYASPTLDELRDMIKHSWERQYKRQGKLNADLAPREVEEYIPLTEAAQKVLVNATEEFGYSPREIAQVKKIARTINDITYEREEWVGSNEVRTAIKLHGKLPINFE